MSRRKTMRRPTAGGKDWGGARVAGVATGADSSQAASPAGSRRYLDPRPPAEVSSATASYGAPRRPDPRDRRGPRRAGGGGPLPPGRHPYPRLPGGGGPPRPARRPADARPP